MDEVKSEVVTSGESPPQSKGFAKWREAIFLTSVAGMSMLFGFGASISSAKKQDPTGFDKGMTPSRKFESGAALASRALKWGTIYAVTGCGLFFFTVWKLLGVKDLQEFRLKVGGILPRIPKNEPPQGRTEFENLTDLLQYIIDEDTKVKTEQAKLANSVSSTHNVSSLNEKDTQEGESSQVLGVLKLASNEHLFANNCSLFGEP